MGLISNGSTIFDNGTVNAGGSMVFIKKLTASSSATLSFVDGSDGVVLDDTYKEYYITFNNIHPATDNVQLQFNMSTDGGSNYNVTKTTTVFFAYHNEGGNDTILSYGSGNDLAQSTNFQDILMLIGNEADESCAGSLTLFNPASTTYVKHFISRGSIYNRTNYAFEHNTAGYGNTVSAVNAIRFQMSSGNILAGDICLYGIA